MADKLRTTYPHKITFVPGEQPNAAKLSAISSQAKAGLNIIEKAIGDIWGTGGSTEGLHQTNLGRILGDAKYINPALYGLRNNEKFFYVENLGGANKFAGKSTGYLTFRPAFNPDASSSGADWKAQIRFGKSDETTSTKYVTVVSTGDHMVEPGSTDFYINELTGYFKAGTLIANGDFIGYWVDPTEWSQGVEGFNPGVIPDPRTANPSLTISASTDPAFAFKLTIPYREPFTTSAEASSFTGDLPHRVPSQCTSASGNLNDNAISVAFDSDGNKRFWSTAGTDPFHRYYIPSKPANGAAFEQGDIYLWDKIGKQIVEGLEFYVDSADEFQINIKDNAGRLGVIGVSGQFCLVTHGSSLAKTVWALANGLANHTHTSNEYNDSNLDHSTFLNLYPGADSNGVVWKASSEEADDHIQYLHREGSKDGFRDQNKGALLGDLIISENTATGDSYLGDLTTNDSNKIYFGNNIATAPNIKGQSIDPFEQAFDGSGEKATLVLGNSVRLGSGTSDYLTANTKNIKISADKGLIVSSDATDATEVDGVSINRSYHGGITVSSYRPRLNFEDRSTSAYDFKMELDGNALVIDCDFSGENFASNTQSSRFIELTGAGTSTDSRVKFHKPITWISEDQVDGNPDAAPDTRILACYPHNLTVNDSGDNVSNLDGFRMLYQDEPFFHTASNRDYLVFEKTDTNASPPDGGIAFTRNDQTGTRKANLIIQSDQSIFNAEVGDSDNNESAAVFIKGDTALHAKGVSKFKGQTEIHDASLYVYEGLVCPEIGLHGSASKSEVEIRKRFIRKVVNKTFARSSQSIDDLLAPGGQTFDYYVQFGKTLGTPSNPVFFDDYVNNVDEGRQINWKSGDEEGNVFVVKCTGSGGDGHVYLPPAKISLAHSLAALSFYVASTGATITIINHPESSGTLYIYPSPAHYATLSNPNECDIPLYEAGAFPWERISLGTNWNNRYRVLEPADSITFTLAIKEEADTSDPNNIIPARAYWIAEGRY